MLSVSLDAYSVCSAFLRDNSSIFSADELNLISGWIRSRNLRGLASITGHNGITKKDSEKIKVVMQIEAFFKKNADFADPFVTAYAALSSFDRAERLCRITNRRLDHFYTHRDRLDPDMRLVVSRAESFIRRILGNYDDFLCEVPNLLRVTSGATASLSRRNALPPLRLGHEVNCYPGSVPYIHAAAEFFGYAIRMRPITWNRVEFVPKNWKTDRGIACEAEGSLPFQLAFDTYAKRKLKAYAGVDLSDQSVNQRHAHLGSTTQKFATIDLSMASDTLSINTVAWLLPSEWFDYLSAHRATQYRREGGSYGTYAKFSSMGNGATFALETLIFLALVRACGCEEGVVYGDDITIASEHSALLLRALKFFGFVPNISKSYIAGPFRESCGAHYWMGDDVTPFYVRSTKESDLPNMAHNVNGLAAICKPSGELQDLLLACVKQYKLPLVPFSEDTTSGVHVHPYHAYRHRIIKVDKKKGRPTGTLSFYGFYQKSKKVRVDDSRSLFLWHLRANNMPRSKLMPVLRDRESSIALAARKRFLIIGEDQQHVDYLDASGYTIASPKFGRRRRRWIIPAMGLPTSLFDWSEHVTA